jgi:hypothetical protein
LREAKAQGQQYLTLLEEKALEKYLKLMADLGNPVQIKCLPTLAFSIARQRLSNKAAKPPSKNWPQGFQKHYPALRSQQVRAMAWERHKNNMCDKIIHWFEVIGKVLQDLAILPENVYNMDKTGVMLCMLGSIKVLISKDNPQDYRGVGIKHTMVTAIECISASGRSLLLMIIWPATTHQSNWTTFPMPGWHYVCSKSGYTNSKISLEWLKCMFDPQTREQANQKPQVLICDGFGTHKTLKALEFCFENNILLCCLPSHTSHKLQPCNVGVFAPLKAAYHNKAKKLLQGGANTVGKQHFTSLYSPAREKAFTKRNIMAAWAACGLFPFNPDRVLRVTPKPPAQSTVPITNEIRVGSCYQDKVPQMPVTPVLAEGLVLLHSLIKEDTYTLDGTSIQHLERHVQKLVNAAQISFAKRALLHDQKQILTRMNNKAKVCQSTQSLVLGKAKVMSFEDIKVAQAACAAKEVIKGKGKRGQKCKSTAIEADEPEADDQEPEPEPEVDSEPEVACVAGEAINGREKRGWKRKTVVHKAEEPELEVAWTTNVPVPWRAPVVQMI